MDEFLPSIPRLHSDNLSPSGTDLAKVMVRKIFPSLVPRKMSCKHFLVVKEKNHLSVDAQQCMYSVNKKMFVDCLDRVCWCAAVQQWTFWSSYLKIRLLNELHECVISCLLIKKGRMEKELIVQIWLF
jgi:hypothetical protein